MNLILTDINPAMRDAWTRAFNAAPEVKILNSRFEFLRGYDCLVSPANSYGLMDGGIDLAIIRHFGFSLQESVLKAVHSEYNGLIPVGCALLVDIPSKEGIQLAVAPTMRTPQNVANTPNAFLSTLAVLREVRKNNEKYWFSDSKKVIHTIVFSGMCTGAGQMPPQECAYQMFRAYQVAQGRVYSKPVTGWADVEVRERDMFESGKRKIN